jgi:hypothetical protein
MNILTGQNSLDTLRREWRDTAVRVRRNGLALAVVGFLATTAYAWVPIFNAGGQSMKVELDIYSGRLNPSWDLTPQQEQEFLTRLRSLPKGKSGGGVSDKLGYRGFIVTASGQNINGFTEVVISEEIVVGRQAGSVQTFTDKGRALERWLLGTGQRHLAPDLYQEVAKQF